MHGTIAITDYASYDLLRNQQGLEEANFWKPSATRGFHADQFSPFIKLRAPHNAICGFGFLARYSRLPVWLDWECLVLAMGVRASRKCASGLDGYETGSDIKVRLQQRSAASLSFNRCSSHKLFGSAHLAIGP